MIDDDDFDYQGFESWVPTVDEFGMPSNILGPHPEEFFQMLGRIVALSSVLESNLRAFCEYLEGVPQGALVGTRFKELIKDGRSALTRIAAPDDRALADDFLTRGEAAVLRRHIYAHSLWPAQGDGRLFGWKYARNKKGSPIDETKPDHTLGNMREELAEFVDLCDVPYWHRMLSLVADSFHLRTEDDAQ